MKISYKWLKEYLPEDDAFSAYTGDVKMLTDILTAVGLEVEGLEPYESVPGGLEGLIVGEVLTCEKHANADRLRVTTVNTGNGIVQIVCGAPNVAAGQKVVVALPETRLHPIDGEPFTIKKSKIRGVESLGMICAEDEIGLGNSHEGIIVLPDSTEVGMSVSAVFQVYKDQIIEIGLTPNRMDDQSHLGVAKDVCTWLTLHTGKTAVVKSPLETELKIDTQSFPIEVEVNDADLAPRYSGLTISGIKAAPSPEWMQNRLNVLGVRPINNIVDITNYILHATGQPLHAFDADKISGRKIIVETLPDGTPFTTLDSKERKLGANDIMICDGENTPMCIAGVFGGVESGVSENTKNIFLESAVFNPAHIRKSIIKHDLRTEAAARFEKGVDISKTVQVLKYAASLITQFCGGLVSSDITDLFRKPAERVVELKYDYLRKLSGRSFEQKQVENILSGLGYVINKSDEISIIVRAPESNPDVSLPADVVEDILRISGLDNIPIPGVVKMTPGSGDNKKGALLEEKISSWLTGNGFFEIFTNSITSKSYFEDNTDSVRILNSLSQDLTVLRKDMLPTALEAVSHNINRQNKDLSFFEFGKTYRVEAGVYETADHLCVYCTGQNRKKTWNAPAEDANLFYLKGVAQVIFKLAGLQFEEIPTDESWITLTLQEQTAGTLRAVDRAMLAEFDIKQPVFYLDIDWNLLRKYAEKQEVTYRPVSKFPVVSRDISMILNKEIAYGEIEKAISLLRLGKLSGIQMFDLYESDKLGKDKKSIALSFSFADEKKTLTDKETDKMVQRITQVLENDFHAEIRSHA